MRRSSRNGVATVDEINRVHGLTSVSLIELQRLMLLKETGILDTKADEKYDRLTSIASRVFKVS
jgi:hypothetical protein